MTDGQKIKLVRAACSATEKATRAVQTGRGEKTALERERKAIRALLRALFVHREPTEAEIEAATPGGKTE